MIRGNSANGNGSCHRKCSLRLHHLPIFHSSYGYAHDEGMVKTSRHHGGGLCAVDLGSGTRYMVRYAQDEDQPYDCVDNPTRFNSESSAAKREKSYSAVYTELTLTAWMLWLHEHHRFRYRYHLYQRICCTKKGWLRGPVQHLCEQLPGCTLYRCIWHRW